MILSVLFNELLKASPLFLGIYLATGTLAAYGAYSLNAKKIEWWTKIISLLMIILGLAGTTFMFIVGLRIKGVIGPAWILFLVVAWRLWRNRYIISKS